MHILVINGGSSSIKFSIFASDGDEPVSLFEGEVSGIGSERASFSFRNAEGLDVGARPDAVGAQSPLAAIGMVVAAVSGAGLPKMDAVGYRVVHPGAKLNKHQRITVEVLKDMEEAIAFAPLHDPAAIEVIREMMKRFPDVAHFACFDTVFHQTMPAEATTYAIPAGYREQGVRRYGFHGLSCESIVRQLIHAAHRGEMNFPRRMVIAHLGSGCSVTAVADGVSIDTSMGLTPTGGVVMGTRPGDLDPGLVLYLLRQQPGNKEVAIHAVESLLNHRAGMAALSGMPNDVKAMREAAVGGDEWARLALTVFTRSVRKAIGGFCWLMGRADAVVFAGGIGEHDPRSRQEILSGLEDFGISMDFDANDAAEDGVRRISASESNTAVFVVPAKEDLMIAIHVNRMMRMNI